MSGIIFGRGNSSIEVELVKSPWYDYYYFNNNNLISKWHRCWLRNCPIVQHEEENHDNVIIPGELTDLSHVCNEWYELLDKVIARVKY